MTEAELKVEHKFRYNERLDLLGQFGTPTESEHNLAVAEANEIIQKLRQEDGLAVKLRELRLSL